MTSSNSLATDYSLAFSAASTLMRGTHVNSLIDISTDWQSVLPLVRQFFQLQVTNNSFTGNGQSPTLTIDRSRGFKINRILLTWNLPQQVARNSWDKMAYDSIPGINSINMIEVIIGSTQFETVTPAQIISRYFNYYGPELFIRYAKDWWGGIKTDNICTPLQQLQGIQSGVYNASDPSQNIILPQVHIILPAPISILFNPEKFCFVLSQDTGLEFKMLFQPSSVYISRTPDCVLAPNNDSVNVFIESLNPCEVTNFWNNIPYVNQNTSENAPSYFFRDQYIEVQTKSFMANQAFQMPLKFSIMRRLETQLYESRWSSSLQFFGDTVQSATANWLASMFFVNTLNHNTSTTIDLSTGLFLNGLSTYSNLSIISYSSRNLVLSWQKTQGVNYTLSISCDSTWQNIGPWYLDLGTYANQLPGSNVVAPHIFMLQSFNLNVVPWTAPIDNNIMTFADSRSLDGSSQILSAGYYTLNYDTTSMSNTHGFFAVNKVVLSPRILLSTWAYLISANVPGNNGANILVSKNFPYISRNQYQFFDLDCLIPITVSSLLWEKNGSNTETVQSDILQFSRNIDQMPNFFRSPLEIEYSMIDPVHKIDSYGFLDLRDSNYVNYTLTCSAYPLVFDNIVIGEIWKDKINNGIEILVCSMQTSLREMAYTPSSQLIILTDFSTINNTLIQDVLIPDDYFNQSLTMTSNVAASNRSVNMSSLRSMARLSGGRKRALADSAGAAYTHGPEQSYYLDSINKRPKFK